MDTKHVNDVVLTDSDNIGRLYQTPAFHMGTMADARSEPK